MGFAIAQSMELTLPDTLIPLLAFARRHNPVIAVFKTMAETRNPTSGLPIISDAALKSILAQHQDRGPLASMLSNHMSTAMYLTINNAAALEHERLQADAMIGAQGFEHWQEIFEM